MSGGSNQRPAQNVTATLISCTSLLVASFTLIAICQGAPVPELNDIFRLSLPTADIVILVDASLSMRRSFPTVRQAAASFGASLTNKEYLHLRAFAGVPTAPLEGVGNQVGDEVVSYLPKDVLAGGTDLGLALEKGLDFLERPGASRIQAVFLLTDGRHEPPRGSPYSRDFDRDPNWQKLQNRAQALCRQRTMLVYGFGLNQQTDINLLLHVFPSRNVEIVVGSAAGVNNLLLHLQERLHLEQLRGAIQEEMTGGKLELKLNPTSISTADNHSESLLTIRNDYEHLPVRLKGIFVNPLTDVHEIDASLKDFSGQLTLGPGDKRQVRVTVSLVADLPKWHIGRMTQTFSARFKIVPSASFPLASELKGQGFDPDSLHVSPLVLSVHIGARYGVPLLIAALLVLALLAWIVMIRMLRNRRLREAEEQKRKDDAAKLLRGHLVISTIELSDSPGEACDLGSYNAQHLFLAKAPEGHLEILTPDQLEGRIVVARLSGQVATRSKGEKLPQYGIEAETDHVLVLESPREVEPNVTPVVLYDADAFEIDAKWRLRYTNSELQRRFVARSSFER